MAENPASNQFDAVKAIMKAGEARDEAATELYQQALRDIEQCPEDERKELKAEAWQTFARANQAAHERQMQALRDILNGKRG